MAKLIMGIGIPGSGKTTLLKPFAQKNSYAYISPDDIRQEMTQDASDQTKNNEVWEEVRRRVQENLREGKTVVVDATFYKDFERKNFIKFARENGAEKIQGVFLDVPIEIADNRNKLRDRTVPEHAMQRIDNALTKNPPMVEDGFDAVFDFDEFQKLFNAEKIHKGEVLVKDFKPKLR